MISGSEDGNMLIFNFKPKSRPFKYIGHKATINEIAINPLGNLIATASNDETIRLWDNTM